MQQCLKCVRFVVPHSCDSSKKSLGSLKRHIVCRHSADSTWKIGRIFVKQDRTKMQIFLENFSTNKHFIVDLAYREDLLCSKCGIVPCIFSDLKLHDNTVHSIMRHNQCWITIVLCMLTKRTTITFFYSWFKYNRRLDGPPSMFLPLVFSQ